MAPNDGTQIMKWSDLRASFLRHPLLVSITLAFVIAFAVVLTSPTFEQCIQANQSGYSANSYFNGIAHLLGISWWCLGIFSKENSEAITAIATVVMAAFTGTLWRATTKQGDLTKQALELSTRAFVFLQELEVSLSEQADGIGFDPKIGKFSFTPKWHNSGDTPTRKLELRITCRLIEDDLPENFDYFYQDPPLEMMIGPKAYEYGHRIEVAANDANNALDGNTNIYLWGRADYRDVFNYKRFTTFCYRVQFSIHDQSVGYLFVPYGSYNRTDADQP